MKRIPFCLFFASTVIGFLGCVSKPEETAPSVVEQPTPVTFQDLIAIRDQLLRQQREPNQIFESHVAFCQSLNRDLKLGEECLSSDQTEKYLQLGRRIQDVQSRLPMDPKNQVDHKIADGLRRTLHAKAHACVKGFIEPLAKRSPETFAGVLSDSQRREVWIRFSNAQGIVQPDSSDDARGMAIKIMGLPSDGRKFARIDDGKTPSLISNETQTQDFLMTNKPRGSTRNAEEFVGFAEASAQGKLATFAFFAKAGRLDELKTLLDVSKKRIDSVLKETYWSGGPILWGQAPSGRPRAVKFKFEPCRDPSGELPIELVTDIRPTSPAADYLKQDLIHLLANHDECFQMSIQVQKDPVKQPLEDGYVLWREEDTPALPAARVLIPRQNFDSPEQNEMCEHLTFNPWNGLAAHRPLGDLNRARRFVYPASQEARLRGLPGSAKGEGPENHLEPRPNDQYWKINPL